MDCKLAKVNSKSGQYLLILFWWYPPDLIDGVNTQLMSHHEACGFVSVCCPFSTLNTCLAQYICQALLPVVLGPGNEAGSISTSQYWGWHLYCSKSSIGRKASTLPNTTSPAANLPEKVTACCCYGRSLHPLVRECTSYLDDQCIQLHKYSPYECLHNTLRDWVEKTWGSSSYAISFTTSDLWFVSNLEVLLPWKNVPREPVLVSKRWE